MKFVRQYYPDNNRDPLKTRESNVDPLRCGARFCVNFLRVRPLLGTKDVSAETSMACDNE